MAILSTLATQTIIDLGCGESKEAGALGVDNVQLPGVDVVHDLLDFPYPFQDNSAEHIYLKHVIEHFDLPDIQHILAEVQRILKPGGVVHIHVPHVYSVAAWVDPTHRMAFTFLTAQFFDSRSAKAYYKELTASWNLIKTSARVIWFDWKRYRLRKVDNFLSKIIAAWINWLLCMPNVPAGADLLVKILPVFFVEIRWELRKPTKV